MTTLGDALSQGFMQNFPSLAIKILSELGADVLTVRDVRRHGHPDENQAAEALRLGRILITGDRDYLNDRRFRLIHCPALIVFDFGNGTVDDIRSTFACLGGPFSVPQFFDKWTKIHATRDGWTEHTRHLDGTTAARIAACSSKNAVSLSSAKTVKRRPAQTKTTGPSVVPGPSSRTRIPASVIDPMEVAQVTQFLRQLCSPR